MQLELPRDTCMCCMWGASKGSELHLYVRIVDILVGIKFSENEQDH